MAGILSRSICKWCEAEMVPLIADEIDVFDGQVIVTICPRCDTSPSTNPGNRLHAGPPKMPGSKNGWFLPRT